MTWEEAWKSMSQDWPMFIEEKEVFRLGFEAGKEEGWKEGINQGIEYERKGAKGELTPFATWKE
jgi:hypothetical protein